jgi:meso-butanediol dehydrogenase / (S,S)-butanediol dehydrogenase / diacetyl reductase
MTGRLQDKVALITGTAGGQGREAALQFAAEGAVVVGCDLDAERSRETLELVEAAGGRMTATAPVDLGDGAQATKWVEDAVERHGRIDVLYNNASAARFAPIAEMSDEDWHFTIRNELHLVLFVTRAAWPHLAKRGGVVINVASVAGLRGTTSVGMVAHCATKGGVAAMTRQLAVEGAPVGIRAVSISPGAITTPATAFLFDDPEAREHLLAGNLIKRPGEPKDVVAMAVLLASDDASFITGVDMVVDGGMTAK